MIPATLSPGAWIDRIAGIAIGMFFAVPTLRAFAGISILGYLVPAGAILVCAVVNLALLRTRPPGPHAIYYIGVTAATLTWLLSSSVWTGAYTPILADVVRVAGILALLLVVPLTINRASLRTSLLTIIAVGVGVAGFVVGSYLITGSMRGYDVEFRDGYLLIAQAVGVATVASSLYTMKSPRRRWWWWVVSAFLFVGLGLALARGALLSGIGLIIAAGLYVIYSRPLERSSLARYVKSAGGRILTTGTLVFLVGGIIAVALTVQRTRARLERLVSGIELQAGGRGEIWEASWRSIQEAPLLGHGFGSYAVETAAAHPHNLFLQVWMDGGLIAVIGLAIVVVLPLVLVVLRGSTFRRGSTMWLPFLGVYLFLILEYSKSSNFYTARTLILSGVLTVCCLTAEHLSDAGGGDPADESRPGSGGPPAVQSPGDERRQGRSRGRVVGGEADA